ncbi:UbiA family prenyltransferase [Palleronia sp. KMU-117]|uniref:UbiA family prenyltransferase n=1 Tax=Palleronia sp. KMU-117 TaxID=3434108 RepID=UPI003D71FC95
MKDEEACTPDPTVLVVDLDGTLCRTDTLHEAFLGLAATRPAGVVALLGRLRDGRAAFKTHLVDNHMVDGDALPLNESVLDLVRRARDEGRRTALVTATHQRQAESVAKATGLFDEVFGTDANGNLKGEAKARFLTERYGAKGFDYVGDSRADLPVWAAARKGITVGASPALARAAESANPAVIHLDPPKSRGRAMLRAMRPHQWSKNLLLFLPVLAAHDPSALGAVVLGFLAFCLTASAVYVMNDLVDLPADRAHPRKRLRPFASGELSAATGVAMAGGLLVGAGVLGALTGNPLFLGVLSLYLATTFAYSLWLKRKLIVDVLTLAGLYTIRIIAGGAATGIVLSPWMLGFSMFLFLALAAVKRQAELTDQLATGRESAGRAYEVEDLPILRGIALGAAHAAVLVMALYVSSNDVQALYTHPQILWLICPLLLYWLLRMVMMTHRGYMTDDPIVFAAKDRVSWIWLIMVAAVVVVAS